MESSAVHYLALLCCITVLTTLPSLSFFCIRSLHALMMLLRCAGW